MSELTNQKELFYSNLAKELKPLDKESLKKFIEAIVSVTKADQARIENNYISPFNNGFNMACKKVVDEMALAITIIESKNEVK